MHLKNLAFALILSSSIAGVDAWRVGLWGKNSDIQRDGQRHACYNISPGFKAGQATFDGHSCCWADGNELVLFSEDDCNTSHRCFSVKPSLKGVNIVQDSGTKGCTVRSFRIL